MRQQALGLSSALQTMTPRPESPSEAESMASDVGSEVPGGKFEFVETVLGFLSETAGRL